MFAVFIFIHTPDYMSPNSVAPKQIWKWGGHRSDAKHRKKFFGCGPPLFLA